ncbi:MAG: oxygen-independent coproporphyrinogen-3 oxidase [Planctomycetota bacterium]|jgi:oxygen-independent coproporphyrinogen-3 oxidase
MTDQAQKTTVGNYFISNYPPYSFWNPEAVGGLDGLLAKEAPATRDLGVYVHIPFCRKRCHFCYFKVYTDKNSKEVVRYLDAVGAEAAAYASTPYIAGRKPRFVYFGGGTPSYLSSQQLEQLFGRLRESLDWSAVEEVTFECEPGTLSLAKLQTLRDLGVTRLSLGVENFNPKILELNNRAHRDVEIERTYGFAREVGFPQVNIDLIAGMVGETDENWSDCVRRTCEMQPDSVTIYQMEVPYNTTIYAQMKDEGAESAPVADWETKRRWVAEAFGALGQIGFSQNSAYTANRKGTSFLYRDSLWHGADMLGLGVSAFSHLGGLHFQNEASFEPYVTGVDKGELPVSRAYQLEAEERLIREWILQLKTGHVLAAEFQDKFGVDPLERFADVLAQHAADGYLNVESDGVRLTPEGLLLVDGLLPAFFLPQHLSDRYV